MDTVPLWRQYRTLANSLRLEIISLLARSSPLCVKEIAGTLLVAEEVACKNLQLLAVPGFVAQEHDGKFRYYTLNDQNALISEILGYGLTREQVINTVTALTHERRISILMAVASEPLERAALCRKTGISRRAMTRHLEKLERRGFLKELNGKCLLTMPDSLLGRRMIKIVLKCGTPAQVCPLPDRI